MKIIAEGDTDTADNASKSNNNNVYTLVTQRDLVALKAIASTVAAQQVAILKQEYVRGNREVRDALTREAHAPLHGNRDELTGPATRQLLKDRFDQAPAQGARRPGITALILLDLDDFKTINDQLGHNIGDEVLRAVASRLIAVTCIGHAVYRYGGDEVVVLIPEIDGLSEVDMVALKIQLALSKPYLIDNYHIRMQASNGNGNGNGNYPGDGTTCKTLVQSAGAALYRAKTVRRNVKLAGRIGT
ncbi:MAG: diguanylate cyclase domain-containing protein [Gammaproteobacteria bacterium]